LKLLTLSVDVDTLAGDFYDSPLTFKEKQFLIGASFEHILPRVKRFLNDNGINATFFLIGKYAKDYQDAVFEIFKDGNEIGNHTFSHRKDFVKLEPGEIFAELMKCHDVILNITNTLPYGFRAPGYTINSTVMKYLKEMGYYYDTSIIPSWSYQSLKMVYRLFCSKTEKDFFIPQELTCTFAPSTPYKVDPESPFKKSKNSSFYEIPISVFPLLQIPLLNAIQIRIFPAIARLLESVIFQRSFVSVNFHDIEFATIEDFGHATPGLLVQNYLKIPLEQRLGRMSEMITYAKSRNFHIVTNNELLNKYKEGES